MKEWKCKDCCCFGTDACMYPYVEEHYKACSRLVVDHDKAYMQGRADAIDECVKALAESEDTILSDRQYYALMELKEKE